jgi:CRP-like cAMP-binding protein
MISPELLRRFPFFGFMTDSQLTAVSMIAEEINFNHGSNVFEANAPATSLYFLIDGSVSYYH